MAHLHRYNQSSVSEFILVGLSETSEPQVILFLIFLCIYLITIIGNIIIITVISSDQRFHTPMYFFLANLAVIDIIFSSVTVPKLLSILITAKKFISYSSCLTQLSFFQFFVVAECYLLAVMAYDRYVAICFPLNYTLIMSRMVRIRLVITCWVCGLINSTVQALSISRLNFCGTNVVEHFFCDVTPLFKLSCSDTKIDEIVFLLVVVFAGFVPLFFILVTYGRIIYAVTRINSRSGRTKTFSTCASHFTVVALYYGCGTFSYIWPSSTAAMDKDVKVVAVLYTIMTPMLNPIIYSLRNKKVKEALSKFLEKLFSRDADGVPPAIKKFIGTGIMKALVAVPSNNISTDLQNTEVSSNDEDSSNSEASSSDTSHPSKKYRLKIPASSAAIHLTPNKKYRLKIPASSAARHLTPNKKYRLKIPASSAARHLTPNKKYRLKIPASSAARHLTPNKKYRLKIPASSAARHLTPNKKYRLKIPASSAARHLTPARNTDLKSQQALQPDISPQQEIQT
ncbi:olfactory receptor 1019-like [Bombina bombina]|uniref:olfactory receptor 1019-like n=1 Tax=Bombina bombina TaxID=8345 RepID=UPI00235A9684|nr:olfactory receptor 1019-like [Bombina bombina]